MKVVCVSDTHGLHDEALAVPDGDVFVHAGDFTDTGERSEVLAFNAFLGTLPHRYKIVIAGNHESTFDRDFYPKYWHQYGHRQQYDPDEVRALLTNALYLEDQAVLIEGYLFYGTPWQPEFCNWAFNRPRGEPLLRQWRRIPTDTDVLVTHTPPMGHGDLVGYQRVGCADLLREVESRVRPRLHVFGHVHEGYGRSASPDGKITYFNASICTHSYEPVNAPFVFELTEPPKRGWPKNGTTPVLLPSGDGMRKSFSSNDVSSMSSVTSTVSINSTADGDVIMDTTVTTEYVEPPRDYALLLHERLRLCSQKVPFVEKPIVNCGNAGAVQVDGKTKLREFRVDGTTSGMLFESTLKLRPVVNMEKRALRYLFSQGFRSNTENYKAQSSEAEVDAAENHNSTDATTSHMEVDSECSEPAPERRKHGLARRVTVAMLDGINETKEQMDALDREHMQQARVAAATLGKDPCSVGAAGEGARARRPRRNKTLQRRSAVPKLASLTEEHSESSDKAESDTASAQGDDETKASGAHTATEAIVVAPPIVECALCKYKVPGHIHPGTAVPAPPPAPVESVTVAPPAVECALCKYKVPGHVHPGTQPAPPPAPVDLAPKKPEEERSKEAKEQRSKANNPPPKRLSSWF
ncbi:Metallophosphoesterase mpped2 [Phytophthora boehmeriae]|uniref:Metallophosphoesterase mpped2 n=1 Tax=Phytophthora boehmeriae TaxID=109152 RepID=A0A8T1WP92_9STRA|nr:Metallophosphoesterase mpped2 [Phytophthora boehmeriae]